MEPDFDWEGKLFHRRGAPANLDGIDVFVDFDWERTIGHPQTQFTNGQCLARRIKRECPEGKTPCLLLTERDEVPQVPFESERFFVVVVNLPRYLKQATSDASASYFSDSAGIGLTRMGEISAMSVDDVRTVLDLKLTSKGLQEWATGSARRIESLRKALAAIDDGPGEEVKGGESSLAEVVEALRLVSGLDASEIEDFAALFSEAERRGLVRFLSENDLLTDDVARSVDYRRRCGAVDEFEGMLVENLTEGRWQKWFEENDWVLGSEFVQILEERPIDVENIADYLMEAYDGFLDLVEIKRPEGKLRFWADARDHGNLVPHTELVKAITQASRYIFEVEREANSQKFSERVGVRVVKPRCVLIYGRSDEWNEAEREAYRVLNAGYSNLTIMTFDQVLERARRILALTAEAASD
jgi:hypothetical protein